MLLDQKKWMGDGYCKKVYNSIAIANLSVW